MLMFPFYEREYRKNVKACQGETGEETVDLGILMIC
jgi:hypothetical protein